MRLTSFALVGALLICSGCSMVGLPVHGGGKRFAVEQELVSASARAVAKKMDLSALKGKKCTVALAIVGDEGSGTLSGGRYSIDANLRGEYISTPWTRTQNTYDTFKTSSYDGSTGAYSWTEIDPQGGSTTTKERQHGTGDAANAQMGYKGLGDYASGQTANPNDVVFLKAVLEEALTLNRIELVEPGKAEVTVQVTVGVFGTIRGRFDTLLYNRESLTARTVAQVAVVGAGEDVIKSVTLAFDATYLENYICWLGPIWTSKKLIKTTDLIDLDAELAKME